MNKIENIQPNPRCVASVTVRIHKAHSAIKIGKKTHRILGIVHRTSDIGTSKSE